MPWPEDWLSPRDLLETMLPPIQTELYRNGGNQLHRKFRKPLGTRKTIEAAPVK